MKKFFYYYWKTIIWAAFIAFLLFTSGENLPKNDIFKIHHFDKIVHFFLFLILGILISHEYRAGKKSISKLRIILIAFIPLIYAALTELIQMYYISERQGAWQDFVADTIGIIVGVILYLIYAKRIINQF